MWTFPYFISMCSRQNFPPQIDQFKVSGPYLHYRRSLDENAAIHGICTHDSSLLSYRHPLPQGGFLERRQRGVGGATTASMSSRSAEKNCRRPCRPQRPLRGLLRLTIAVLTRPNIEGGPSPKVRPRRWCYYPIPPTYFQRTCCINIILWNIDYIAQSRVDP